MYDKNRKARHASGRPGFSRQPRRMVRMEIQYRNIAYSDLSTELFSAFTRTQVVTDCWRIVNGTWVIQSDPFIDDWDEMDRIFLVQCLKNTLQTGGLLHGAFAGNQLKGFVSVESTLFGSEKQYADLTSIHVSQEMRGLGIGRNLFEAAKRYARKAGAKKLYISAHSAVETQAFYRSMGCVAALEREKRHIEQEPFDCQLEYLL